MLIDDLIPASRRASEYGVSLETWFDKWFGRCVNRAPEARFSDANDLWNALRTHLGATGTTDPVTAEGLRPVLPPTAPFAPAHIAPTAVSLDSAAPAESGRQSATALAATIVTAAQNAAQIPPVLSRPTRKSSPMRSWGWLIGICASLGILIAVARLMSGQSRASNETIGHPDAAESGVKSKIS